MTTAVLNLANTDTLFLNTKMGGADALYEIGCNPAILFNNTDSWALIRKADSPEALKNFINNITDVVMSYIENAREQKNKSLIERVKAMVDANFADDASLETVAAQVYMSPCYLSVIFKREIGKTPSQYRDLQKQKM